MHTRILLLSCLLSILVLPVAIAQQAQKERKYSGRFAADQGPLVVDNRYGKLDIRTWDRNEVTVDITVSAKARSAAAAQDILDKVSIAEPRQGSGSIHYKTQVGNERSMTIKGDLNINYVIYMPRRHHASFTNKYGDIDLAEVDGHLDINLEYGKLRTAAIRGADKEIRVGYGSASIPSIDKGTITAAYSKLNIDKAGVLRVSNRYEKTTIGSVRELDIDQRYGDLRIGTVQELAADVQFGGLSVERLLKSLDLDMRYGSGGRFEYIGPDVDHIRVAASYSNTSYHFDDASSLAGNVALSYGNVSSGSAAVSLSKSGGNQPGMASAYRVKVGGGKGSLAMTASYGNIVFR